MSSIKSFEDLVIWQESKKLTVEIYSEFRSLKDYGIKDQIQRAAVSVMSNIAEGFERETDKEFIRFLYIAKGSVGEVRSLLILAGELEYLSKEKTLLLIDKSKGISYGIYKLISYLKVKTKN